MALAWDIKRRTGLLPDAGGQVVAHEFDYRIENQVVYEENGVKITSWPAIHSLDGSVSYRLEWDGLSFVFGGDSRPNRWFIKYARDADFAIHECFPMPDGLAAFNDWEMRPATFVSSHIHTPPEGFGKIMAEIKPRMAVAYHTVLLPDIRQAIRNQREAEPVTVCVVVAGEFVTRLSMSRQAAVSRGFNGSSPHLNSHDGELDVENEAAIETPRASFLNVCFHPMRIGAKPP